MSHERVTMRRTLEQICHCAKEALSVVEHGEDVTFAIEDLEQARDLIDIVLRRMHQRDKDPR